jgi:hypothetical protein
MREEEGQSAAPKTPVAARPSYFLTRLVLLRLLGGVYFVAFLGLVGQLGPLIGRAGLLPAHTFLDQVAAEAGSRAAGFWALPSLFWLGTGDTFLQAAAWVGLGLSAAVVLGATNAVLMALLWALYMSFVHIGQLFYGYGWEILLLEAGFLAIFLCPLRSLRPLPAAPPSPVVLWLLRWTLFRVMLGAGLIKLRGDSCWRELTCLFYHYETQPLPNPLSWLLNQAPPWLHKLGVLWNHFIELFCPLGLFGPRRLAALAGVLQIAFQLTLILSGNLAFLNWLTLTLAFACFDDQALARVLPRRLVERAAALAEQARPARAQRWLDWTLLVVIAALSIKPVVNLLSPGQLMNSSFDRLHLVNTYGAFGSVGQKRSEVILLGTDAVPVDGKVRWREYEWKCKPGDVRRRPCVVAPYQLRLDWQIWFAAMSSYDREPWLLHLVYKLLQGDRGALSLLASNPFPEGAPKWIRAELFEYKFTTFKDRDAGWWTRRRVATYLPPVSLDTVELREFIAAQGWPVAAGSAPAAPGMESEGLGKESEGAAEEPAAESEGSGTD